MRTAPATGEEAEAGILTRQLGDGRLSRSCFPFLTRWKEGPPVHAGGLFNCTPLYLINRRSLLEGNPPQTRGFPFDFHF